VAKNLRIVSLAPNATSILCALGGRSSLVGVTRWCPDVAPVKHLPQFGDCWKLESIPEILSLKPDLVIGSVPFKTETLGELLKNPVRFLALNPRSLGDIESDIRVVAGLIGREFAATRAIQKMRRSFAKVHQAARGKATLRVYCEAWPNPRISSPPWVAELVRIAGGRMIVPPGQKISEEQVARGNPEIIVLAWAAAGDRAKPAKCYSLEKWRSVAAIRNRHVFVVPDEFLNTPAPILMHGVRQLAKLFARCRTNIRSRS
jgi:iron complex transport system substrate-binding protein